MGGFVDSLAARADGGISALTLARVGSTMVSLAARADGGISALTLARVGSTMVSLTSWRRLSLTSQRSS